MEAARSVELSRSAAFGWQELERAVWPVFVVMAPVDAEHVLEVSATEDEDPVKAVGSDGAHPALSVSVRRLINRRHLERVLRVFTEHYNTHRPHRALSLTPPAPTAENVNTIPAPQAAIERRDRLGGLIHEYHVAA